MTVKEPNTYTLEQIMREKAVVRNKISKQSERIKVVTNGILAPFKPAAKSSSTAIKAFSSGMTIVDSFIFGYRIFSKLRRFFR